MLYSIQLSINTPYAKSFSVPNIYLPRRYEKLLERSFKRGQFLEEVSVELMQFTQQATALESAHSQLAEMADARDDRHRLAELVQARDKQMPLLEECLRNGKQLLAKKDVTDTHVVRDRMKVREV